jgi:metal-sulfur cluster biosynthetic enzyme
MAVTVNHRFVSPKPEQSDPTIVGPNEWNAQHNVIDTSNTIGACDYNFVPQSPGGLLIIGSNPIVFNPLPSGLVIGGSLYISGGTGAAEAVTITGIAGNTVSVPCANTHGGAWTIQSATGGLQEAIGAAPASGSIVIIACNITLNANVIDLGKQVLVEKYGGVAIGNTATFSIYGAKNLVTADVEICITNKNQVTYRNVGMDWSTNGNWAAITANVNNHPKTAFFGAGTYPDYDAVRGAIVEGTGVAGYSLTSIPNHLSLGVYGQAGTSVDNASCFGGNFLVTNSQPQVGAVGHDIATIYGVEIDVNIQKKSDGTDPTVSVRGLYITGGSVASVGGGLAIDIESPGQFQTPKLKWGTGIKTEDGAATTALDVGCLNVGNNTGSQAIYVRSRDASGVNRSALISCDPNGDFTMTPGTGASLVLSDGNLVTGAQVIPNGSTPYFQVPFQLNIAHGNVPPTSTSPGTTGSISWDANYMYVCVATNTWKRTALTTW